MRATANTLIAIVQPGRLTRIGAPKQEQSNAIDRIQPYKSEAAIAWDRVMSYQGPDNAPGAVYHLADYDIDTDSRLLRTVAGQ